MVTFKTFSIIVFLLCCFTFQTNAKNYQLITDSIPSDTIKKKVVAQIDLTDILNSIFRKKPKVESKDSLHPKKVYVSIMPGIGYTLQTGIAIGVSANIAFKTSKAFEQKVSNISGSFAYSQYNQIIFPIAASIWSRNNRYKFEFNGRYLKYPSNTYGLGGNSKIEDMREIDFSYIKLHSSVLRHIGSDFYVGAGYYLDLFWKISDIDLKSKVPSQINAYGYNLKEIASGVALRFVYDSRLNQINPQGGFFAGAVYRPNLKVLGSNSNWSTATIELKKYIKLPGRSKNILAFWNYNWLTMHGKPPYLLLPSSGWDDTYNTARGYIQGRFRDYNMFYVEAEYRFRITANGLIGGVAFLNTQSFSGPGHPVLQNFAPGGGAGLRLKVNKHSNTNISIDYGFGLDGSRGFFVNLGEVF